MDASSNVLICTDEHEYSGLPGDPQDFVGEAAKTLSILYAPGSKAGPEAIARLHAMITGQRQLMSAWGKERPEVTGIFNSKKIFR